jgi:sec-independent protein translocase protein TatB
MLSIPHMIIIFIVALVFFGPEKLPELARNVGKIMAEFKRATGDFRSTFEDHLRELEREADQRRISGKTSTATAAVPSPSADPPEPGTNNATPAEPVAGAVPAKAPWEQAADTAADAMNTSTNSAESPETQPNGLPENTSESVPDRPALNPEPEDKPHQQSEATSEPPVHDDLPA